MQLNLGRSTIAATKLTITLVILLTVLGQTHADKNNNSNNNNLVLGANIQSDQDKLLVK